MTARHSSFASNMSADGVPHRRNPLPLPARDLAFLPAPHLLPLPPTSHPRPTSYLYLPPPTSTYLFLPLPTNYYPHPTSYLYLPPPTSTYHVSPPATYLHPPPPPHLSSPLSSPANLHLCSRAPAPLRPCTLHPHIAPGSPPRVSPRGRASLVAALGAASSTPPTTATSLLTTVLR